MLKAILLLACTLVGSTAWSQADSTSRMDSSSPKQDVHLKIYKTHPGWEIPTSLALIGAASLGYKVMDQRASLTADEVLALNPESINSFDRPAAFYNPAGFTDAQNKSDIIMTAVVASPLLLMFGKKMRRDWGDLLSMFLATHAADNTIFFSTILAVRRPRPLVYNTALSINERTGVGKSNSFFSGHVSWAAASSFFIVKVYTDYHKIKGLKRILLYTGAAVPPTIVGYYRVHAGRHFESDAILGLIVGGACGIVVPELHRIKNKVQGLSLQPFSRYGSNGISVSYILK